MRISDWSSDVCSSDLPVRTAHHAEHEGITHHFCSARCLERFVADPARYLTRQSDDVPAPTGTMYTCPMHPQVRQDRSEEHTSELQSLMRISYAVFCLKKKTLLYLDIIT